VAKATGDRKRHARGGGRWIHLPEAGNPMSSSRRRLRPPVGRSRRSATSGDGGTASQRRVCRALGSCGSSPAGGAARTRPGGRPGQTRTRTGRRSPQQLPILRRWSRPWPSR